MVDQFLPLFVTIALAVFVGFFVVFLGAIFGPRKPTERKGQPYESGMIPYGPGTRRISVRYYLVAVLFILFDVELVFFLPYAVVLRELGKGGLVMMVSFVLVLMIGFVYAWKKGALEWE